MKVSYPVERVVSVWIGLIPTERDFDRCVDVDVVKRLHLNIPIESICEVAFEQKPVPLRQLIEGFSGWEGFLDQVEAAAKVYGVESANAALICYYLRCDDAPEFWGNLRFLGNFVGQDAS